MAVCPPPSIQLLMSNTPPLFVILSSVPSLRNPDRYPCLADPKLRHDLPNLACPVWREQTRVVFSLFKSASPLIYE